MLVVAVIPNTGLVIHGLHLLLLGNIDGASVLDRSSVLTSTVLRCGSCGTAYNLFSCADGRRPAEGLFKRVLAIARSIGIRCPASSRDVPQLGDLIFEFARTVRLEKCDGASLPGGKRKESYNAKHYTRCMMLMLSEVSNLREPLMTAFDELRMDAIMAWAPREKGDLMIPFLKLKRGLGSERCSIRTH